VRLLRKLLLPVAENIFIAIKGKWKILPMEISPANIYSYNCEIFTEGGPYSDQS